MHRRAFLSSVSLSVTGSVCLSSRPVLSADITIGEVDSASTTIESVLVDFEELKIFSKYIDDEVESDISVAMSLEGEVVKEISDTVLLSNDRYVSLIDKFSYISKDNLDIGTELYSEGEIAVRVAHPSLANKSVFRRGFSITPFAPVAHWSLSDSSVSGDGGVVEDVSGNGFDGETKNGVTTDADGKSGTAFEFDGSSSYIELPSLDGVHSTDGDRTVSAWVYADSHSETYNHIFQYGKPSTNNAFSLTTRQDGGLSEHTWGGNPSRNSIGSVPTDEWVHLAITYSKQSDIRKYYVNGSLVGSIVDQGAPNTVFSNARIGARLDSITEYWDGRIQDVRLYDETLTGKQVNAVISSVEENPLSY